MSVGIGESLAIPVNDELTLRQATIADAPVIFDAVWEAPDYFGKFDPGLLLSFSTLRATEHQIQTQYEQKKIFCMWVNNELAGAVNLIPADITPEHATYRIGYWIREQHASQGHTSRAAKAAIEYAFSEMDVQQVNARIRLGNVASAATAQNAGFRYMATEQTGTWLFSTFSETPDELQDIFSEEVYKSYLLKSEQRRSVAWLKLDGVNQKTINHMSDTTYYVQSGEATFVTEANAEFLETGDEVFVSCGTPHQFVGRTTMLAVCEPGFDERQIEIIRPSTSNVKQ